MTKRPITFDPVRARTYCRNLPDRRETWKEVAQRCGEGFRKLAGEAVPYKDAAKAIENCEVFPAGRWLWIGGTDWVMKPKNHMAAFNCISFHLDSLEVIRDAFDLCCQGCGIGEVLEDKSIKQLPPVRNKVNVKVLQESLEEIGTNWLEEARLEQTSLMYQQTKGEEKIVIRVGDSREAWADAIFELMKLAVNVLPIPTTNVEIDLSYVRPEGTPIKGFGGIANPVGLPKMYRRIGEILKGALGRQLTDEELALIIDEGAEAVVAGNVRRSAGMKQFSTEAPNYKENLYTQDGEGNFSVDHKRQPLRMSNHTKVFHYRPSHAQILHSVRNQFQTGEGALQYAPAAIARANRDLLDDEQKRMRFINLYENSPTYAAQYLYDLSGLMMYREELDHRMSRYGLNPCAEILGSNFACNLSEVQLVNADPDDIFALEKRFRLAAQMACAMLEFEFPYEKLEISRQYDPIIGVGLTGWFDFCVKAFGEEWLEWCFAGRPKHTKKGWELYDGEIEYLKFFRKVVNETVTEYCKKRGIKRPNRTTTIKPSGTLSQLSGACPGGHPSKAAYFIRRVTFSANDPVALACLRAGYSVVPSQRCTDLRGNLLDDPFDPRVDEWLVEMPVKAEWTNYVESYFDTQEIPALTQFDIAMTLQKWYAEHNVSYTIEYDEDEIEDLSNAIYEEIGNGNYISFAMMERARAGQLKHAFPRLPYEPISKEEFYELSEKIDRNIDFDKELKHAYQEAKEEDKHDVGTTGCDSTGCTL